MGEKVTRRRFVMLAGGLGGMAIAGRAIGLSSPSDDGVVVGAVVSAHPSGLLVESPDFGEVAVETLPGAYLWRDGPISSSDFREGDEIVAEGAWAEGAFSAHSVTPLYRMATGVVSELGDSEIVVGSLAIALTSDSEVHGSTATPVEVLEVGDAVSVLGRIEPADDGFIGLLLEPADH